MSFYEDAKIMLLSSFGASKDGKAYTVKPEGGGAPLYVTRGSNLTATRVDSNGLIEKGRENLLTYSNDFSNAAWRVDGSLITGQSGYDGSTDASSITADTGDNWILRRSDVNIQQSGVTTFSIYVKKNETNGIRIYLFGTANANTFFDLNNGSVADSNNTINASIEPIGLEWFRCSVTANQTITQLYIYGTDNSTTMLDEVTHIFQDAQLEQGLVATEYIESGATKGKAGLLENEPRFNYPIGGGSPQLLLEPSRTNLLSNSEYLEGNNELSILSSSVTFADYTETSPDGNENALRVLEAEGSGSHNWYYSNLGGVTNGTTYCISFFAKSIRGRNISINEGGIGMDMQGIIDLSDGSILADVYNNISVEPYGNGWYRISAVGAMSGTSQRIIFYSVDGTSTSFEGDTTSGVSLWGVQIEEGKYPTSYIPNHSGGSVTRENEICQNSNIDAVTSISTSQGCVFFDVDLPQGREGSISLFRFWKAGDTTRWGIKGNYEPSPIMSIEGTGTISNSNTTNLSVGRHKFAVRWTDGTADVFIDGAEVSALSTTDSAAPTSFYKLQLLSQGFRHLVHQFIVFDNDLSDDDCVKLTTIV